MGSNKWQSPDSWPPKGAESLSYFLSSGGRANTLNGDGVLTTTPLAKDIPDNFTYDPMHPVMSIGGNVCCQANALTGGSLDQRKWEERDDILVYTTEPLKEGMEVSGPITFTTYVSSDRKDTDITVKIIDLYPDGRAYNLDETIQRLRYRDWYDKPVAMMVPGKAYKEALQPITTRNYFVAGYRTRIAGPSTKLTRL